MSEEIRYEGVAGGSKNKSPSCRKKTKGLWELGEPSTHPRHSMRISSRSDRVRSSPSSTSRTFTTIISDGDIYNCNARFCDSEVLEEPAMLWEIGKHIGIACRGAKVEVVKEYQSMKLRDAECKQRFEEGNKYGSLC